MSKDSRNTLKLALMSALSGRRIAATHHLQHSHGAFCSAEALVSLPCGQMADVMALLTHPSRGEVYRHLSHENRTRLPTVGMKNPSSSDEDGGCVQGPGSTVRSRLFATAPYPLIRRIESGSFKRV